MTEFAHIRQEVLASPPACGSTRIIAIDGRSGAGKTQFSEQLARELGVHIVHLEDVYPGWHGLESGIAAMSEALTNLAQDRPAQLAQWDWVLNQAAAPITLWPSHTLIIEGVGACAASIRQYTNVSIWLEAPSEIRKTRTLSREGYDYAEWWDVWAEQEDAYIAREQPQNHVNLLVSTA